MNNMFGEPFIASAQLTPDVVPIRVTDWGDVVRFAATFDPQSECPSGSSIAGVADIDLNSTIAEMRLALYLEWRRYNHLGYDPDPATVHQTQAILDQLRVACQQNCGHLVYLRSGRLILVKRLDDDWQALQEAYPDFMTSLGPWTANQIAAYFSLDYTEDDRNWPFSRQAIQEFLESPDPNELATE